MGKRHEREQDKQDLERAVDRAIAELTPEQAQEFERLMERAHKRRLIHLWGYVLALFALLAGVALALYVYATADEGSFRAWALVAPVAAMGLIFVVAGRLARRYET